MFIRTSAWFRRRLSRIHRCRPEPTGDESGLTTHVGATTRATATMILGDPERDRDRDDDDGGPHLGRCPSARGDKSEPDLRNREDERWPERDRDPRDLDPRDVFMRDVDLPRGREREIVPDPRDREYTLRGSETRTLSTVGAFRVVRTGRLDMGAH